jgi:Ni/Fe-hydrogenase subunit HybB-like protein
MLFNRGLMSQTWPRFTAASLVIFGLIFNRFNVTLTAMSRPGEGFYFPGMIEVVISLAIVAAIIFFYNLMVKMFPVLPQHGDGHDSTDSGLNSQGGTLHGAS